MEVKKNSKWKAIKKAIVNSDCYLVYLLFFTITSVYFEVFMDLCIGESVPVTGVLMAAGMGCLLTFFVNIFGKKYRMILANILTLLMTVMVIAEFIYYRTFTVPFSFGVFSEGIQGAEAMGDSNFRSMAINRAIDNWYIVLALLIPMASGIAITVLLKKENRYISRKMDYYWKFAALILSAMLCIVWQTVIYSSNSGVLSTKDIYREDGISNATLNRLGYSITVYKDIKDTLFPSEFDEEYESVGDIFVVKDEETTQESTENESPSEPENTEETTEQVIEIPKKEFNQLNIDFKALAQSTEDSELKWLHNYMADSEPTKTNEYTGLFEGYNVILMTAESFSPWAVDENLTPTLYKLVNSGWVFTNFYNSAYGNTSDGEYMVCTGNMPDGQGSRTFQRSSSNYMANCLGYALGNVGYATYAYHPHTYSYYQRDQTHPNMGYIYKGYGNGLDIRKSWPESDLECIEKTIDEYVNAQPFHAYYMTVSGHMDYTFSDNYMSYKNRELVANLNKSEQMRAYIAANIEFDRALEYLIKKLEEKGCLENTVIAFAADHYPYAMEEELMAAVGENAKWYGVHKSNLVIWSASVKEQKIINKACSSIDIVPTLLNLLGMDYDSRLYIGKDIFSDAPGLVMFADKGFATDVCIYNSSYDEVKITDSSLQALPEGYLENVIGTVKQRLKASSLILNTDYYRVIFGEPTYHPEEQTRAPEPEGEQTITSEGEQTPASEGEQTTAPEVE